MRQVMSRDFDPWLSDTLTLPSWLDVPKEVGETEEVKRRVHQGLAVNSSGGGYGGLVHSILSPLGSRSFTSSTNPLPALGRFRSIGSLLSSSRPYKWPPIIPSPLPPFPQHPISLILNLEFLGWAGTPLLGLGPRHLSLFSPFPDLTGDNYMRTAWHGPLCDLPQLSWTAAWIRSGRSSRTDRLLGFGRRSIVQFNKAVGNCRERPTDQFYKGD